MNAEEDGFLGPQYWDYDALDTSPTPPQNTSQPVTAPAPPERTPTPMDTSRSTPTPPTHIVKYESLKVSD